jgi:hypothetical protein
MFLAAVLSRIPSANRDNKNTKILDREGFSVDPV